jgi:hypothetical protein
MPSFVYLLRTSYAKKYQLTSNSSITWSFRLTHQLCQWWALLADLTIESGSFWIEAAIDCVLSVTEWLAPNVSTRIFIRTYKFRTPNTTVQPLRTSFSRNLWHPFAEPSLRKRGIKCWNVPWSRYDVWSKRLESGGGVIWSELHLMARGLRYSSEQWQHSYFLLEVLTVTTQRLSSAWIYKILSLQGNYHGTLNTKTKHNRLNYQCYSTYPHHEQTYYFESC